MSQLTYILMAKQQGELKEILEQAQKQPGLKELMIVYEQYERVLAQCQGYLSANIPKAVTFNSDSSYTC